MPSCAIYQIPARTALYESHHTLLQHHPPSGAWQAKLIVKTCSIAGWLCHFLSCSLYCACVDRCRIRLWSLMLRMLRIYGSMTLQPTAESIFRRVCVWLASVRGKQRSLYETCWLLLLLLFGLLLVTTAQVTSCDLAQRIYPCLTLVVVLRHRSHRETRASTYSSQGERAVCVATKYQDSIAAAHQDTVTVG
jgi:hypothetical protein